MSIIQELKLVLEMDNGYNQFMNALKFFDRYDIGIARKEGKFYLYSEDNVYQHIDLNVLGIKEADLEVMGDDDSYEYLWFVDKNNNTLKGMEVEFIAHLDKGTKGSSFEPSSSDWYILDAIELKDIDITNLLTTIQFDQLEEFINNY